MQVTGGGRGEMPKGVQNQETSPATESSDWRCVSSWLSCICVSFAPHKINPKACHHHHFSQCCISYGEMGELLVQIASGSQ